MYRFPWFHLRKHLTKYSMILFAASGSIYADASISYVAVFTAGNVQRVDLTTGNASVVASFSGDTPIGIALANSPTAYLTTNNANRVYNLDLTTGAFFQAAQLGGTSFTRIQLADSTTAYVGGSSDGTRGNLYRVNLTNGSISLVTTITGVALNELGLEMTLTTPNKAYVAGGNGSVYLVDLTNGSFSRITSIPGTNLQGLSLANNTTAYVTDTIGNNIYSIDLINGNFSLVTPSPIAGALLQGIALSNSTTAYAVGASNANAIYRIDLTSGNFSQVATITVGANPADIAVVLQIGTTGLHGNNLKFANYLNNNAPFYTLPLIALQSDIASALEITSPARNALFTFAAQTTQLAFGQLVADHLGQKRWDKAWVQGEATQPIPANTTAEAPYIRHRLIADASDALMETQASDAPPMETQDQATTSSSSDESPVEPSPILPKNGLTYSPWLAGFGEYTREHKQRQTPAFQAGAGGFVLAFDCYGVYPELLLGSGVAYAHTHVHEDDGFGHANIDQGAVVFYAAWEQRDYYFNMELWGSGYHAKNVREINLPGVIGGSAISSTNGWQCTPHLEVGYDYKDNWLCVEPFMMLDWVANWERGFQEHGAGKLNMGQKGRFCSLLRTEWGLRFNETLSYDWGTATFREKGSYAYQKAFHTGTLTAFLVGSSGTFVVSTLSGAQNLGVVELESLLAPRNKKYPYGTISYQGEFGSRYQSHQGMVTIGMDF